MYAKNYMLYTFADQTKRMSLKSLIELYLKFALGFKPHANVSLIRHKHFVRTSSLQTNF